MPPKYEHIILAPSLPVCTIDNFLILEPKQALFSRDLHMVVPASLLFIYSFFYLILQLMSEFPLGSRIENTFMEPECQFFNTAELAASNISCI